jgi:ABC-type bacteriocin/lantibiotic exporter with double-glycine peptidase domain
MKIIPIPIVNQTNDYSCGECVVTAILKYHNINTKFYKFASEVDGTNPRAIELQLRNNGFNVLAGNFTWRILKQFIKQKLAVIICFDGHYSIICGFENRSIILMNPLNPEYDSMSIYKFKKVWEDYSTDGTRYKQWGIVANPYNG